MIESRQNFRLRKQIDVHWSVPEQNIEGQGKIFNISLAGMLFETDQLFNPSHGMAMRFSSQQIPDLPSKGHLRWFQRVGENKTHYQCGIRFVTEEAALPSWSVWMQENILKLADAGDNNILRRYLGGEI